jgi:Ca-activated chloride channel homolog
MIEIAWPWAAAALVAPWLVARLLPPAPPPGAPLRVPFLAAARTWQRAAGAERVRARSALALAAWVLLVAAACRPQWIGEPVGAPSTGRSLLLALDLSASIRDVAQGAGPEILRAAARRFVAGRTGDRVGLVVFGSKAYVQAPPSVDLEAIAALVDESFIGLAGDGTALGDAVALAVARLRTMSRDQRVLVLLTDGSSTEGRTSIEEAAEAARHHGVRVHAIGLGEPRDPRTAREGEGLDEPALQAVAARTGGRYYRAGDARALEGIYATLAAHEPALGDVREYRPATELYAWPLAAALAFAVAALLLAWRRARA